MSPRPPVEAIPTRYAGHRFRSRLEARWAVFFDAAGIPWDYEPEGYRLGDRHFYLPDFFLPDCGTWVEVKGAESKLDRALVELAATRLPKIKGSGEQGPRLLLLGTHPEPGDGDHDWGWWGFDPDWQYPETVNAALWGFGYYSKNRRPWWLDNQYGPPPASHLPGWLTPQYTPNSIGCPDAYAAARSARFEHGESGAA